MDTSLTYDDILIEPQYSEVISRKMVDTSVTIRDLRLKVPIISANMTNVCSYELCVALARAGGIATVDQFRSIPDEIMLVKKVKKQKLYIAAASGVAKDYQERSRAIIESGADILVFDTPHAHSLLAYTAVSWCKKKFPKSLIACGNVATAEGAKMLIDAGADIIKVGVGPGAACITRIAAGVGVPQFTAVSEVAKIVKIRKRYLIADGGVKTSGNFAKALGAGADLVMFGGVLAGCAESPSELFVKDGKKYKRYYGSASAEAKIVRAQKDKNYKRKPNDFVEGAFGFVPYRGSVQEVVDAFRKGLASAMSYSNAETIRSFQSNVKFTRVTTIGERENGPHGLV